MSILIFLNTNVFFSLFLSSNTQQIRWGRGRGFPDYFLGRDELYSEITIYGVCEWHVLPKTKRKGPREAEAMQKLKDLEGFDA